jgi:pilus assembly protein Flp/PilA
VIKLIANVAAFIENLDGATAIEYGLIACGIALAIVASLVLLGSDLNIVFASAGNAMQNATNSGG